MDIIKVLAIAGSAMGINARAPRMMNLRTCATGRGMLGIGRCWGEALIAETLPKTPAE